MNKQYFWIQKNAFSGGTFAKENLEIVAQNHAKSNFHKGDYLYLPEHKSDKIYIIDTGRIKIGSVNDNGKEVTKAIRTKGEVFGELAMTGQQERRNFALAMEDSEIYVVTVSELKKLMNSHSSLSLFFIKILGNRVLNMENRLESLVFKDSRSRIIEYLLYLVDKYGQRVGYEWVVRDIVTHQEIANLTATSRQTVTTVLNDLRTNNVIAFNRKRLLVRNLDMLKVEVDKE